MEKILCLLHTESNGSLSKNALEALSAAVQVTKEMQDAALTLGLVGQNLKPSAESLADCGAEKVLLVDGADFNESRYSTDIKALEALVSAVGASWIIAPATSRFNRVLPGLTCRLDGRIDTHVAGLNVTDNTLHIQRWYYRQRMQAELSRTQRPWVLLIDSGVYESYQSSGGSTASIEEVPVEITDDSRRTKAIGFEAPSSDAQTIRPDAEVLFVAGAGWTKNQADGQAHLKEAEDFILNFLDKGKASLGSSKSLVDLSSEGQEVLSFMSHLNQVGQTGSTPRHQKGLATCCHGEEPHVVGWRFINERRAINTDASCGWSQGKADVLYVADAFEVMQKVNELL